MTFLYLSAGICNKDRKHGVPLPSVKVTIPCFFATADLQLNTEGRKERRFMAVTEYGVYISYHTAQDAVNKARKARELYVTYQKKAR